MRSSEFAQGGAQAASPFGTRLQIVEAAGCGCNSANASPIVDSFCNWLEVMARLLESRRPWGPIVATQAISYPDDQDADDLGVAFKSFSTKGVSGGRNIGRTNHNCLHDSERIIGICAAMKVVLDFVRAAKLTDLAFPSLNGAEYLQTRTSLESAVEKLELLREQLYRENLVLRDEVDRVSMFEEIVGTSPALQAALSRVAKVAATDSTVMITGETGTGKELVARSIHRRSNRSARAFVSVNCAAIPRDLIASELFGHEKGAFTGATQQRLGRFELANGGTLFLDEVGDLPAETQIALLRVLQEHEFERVGGSRPIRTDVRVIAATNRDLQAAIRARSFRSDLFYRLHVFPIEIPALRERGEDITLLVEYFIDRYARKAGKNIRDISKETLELLQSYSWPGNIRELQNVIERSVLLCETESFSIDESWLPQLPSPPESKDQIQLSAKLVARERSMIEAALKETRGRVFGPTGAAAKLGIPRSTLESRIRSLNIDKKLFKLPA
jgi:transcriptional regulator with GAF, ATPase, and Fis domain